MYEAGNRLSVSGGYATITTMSIIRTRFAPSPTGDLHLGNARTALYAALLARAAEGAFLLRIEDTDAARSLPAHEASLMADLRWLGLNWDEGPDRGGPHGPYRQSEREPYYTEFYARLEAEGRAYPCFCTEEELERRRALQRAAGQPPRYSGTCAALSRAEIEARQTQAGTLTSLRLRVPPRLTLEFADLVRGPQVFRSDDLGDFVIRRSDGSPSFLFANAVDDALMGVTHVLRGADHISNTPRQLLILTALGLSVPQYGHLSLILGADGAPLSKRHGARSLGELRKTGYLPEAVLNHLARLGHPYGETGLLSLDQLAAAFMPKHLGAAPAHHDEGALRHWQREALAAADWTRLWEWLPAEVHALVPKADREPFVTAVRPNLLLPSDGAYWARAIYTENLESTAEARAAVTAASAAFYGAALEVLSGHGGDFKSFTEALKKITGTRGPALFHPLRAALTGTLAGPELARLWKLIPTEQIRQRLAAGT
ncbi:Glutamate--tRNA ligase 2 [Gammaproteobacteria bacterium]